MRGASKLVTAVLIVAGVYLACRYLIEPPIPKSLLVWFVAATIVAVLLYYSHSEEMFEEFLHPLKTVFQDESKRGIRIAILVAIPALAGYVTYLKSFPRIEAPSELRVIHPAPPSQISFRGRMLDIQGLENPLRADKENFQQEVAKGKEIYFKDCFFCHGDKLMGRGHFADAFNPIPANFVDPTTIAMLQESYLFWRISKGGPGLPSESAPWNSAMPAWEGRLTEEEIWDVILYLYEGAGVSPRTWE